jgi:hypothetical protein
MDSYLLAHCTRRDLETWLLSNLQIILDSGEKAAIDLANKVDADLVEFGEGLMDELTLREHLQSYIRVQDTLPFAYCETQPRDTTTASTSAEMLKDEFAITGPVVDLRLEHSFA